MRIIYNPDKKANPLWGSYALVFQFLFNIVADFVQPTRVLFHIPRTQTEFTTVQAVTYLATSTAILDQIVESQYWYNLELFGYSIVSQKSSV